MKRTVLNLVFFGMIVVTISSCSSTMGERFKEGVNDITMSPLQVSSNVRIETPKAQFAPFGVVGGSMKGGFYMGKQILEGIMTMLTFFKAR